MLPKSHRITKELFSGVMKNGKTFSSPLFVFCYIPQKSPQYAFVAPKTVAKQAILRNKLRRQGYNALSQNPKIPSVLGIFFYKKQAKIAPFEEIKKGINEVFSKINL